MKVQSLWGHFLFVLSDVQYIGHGASACYRIMRNEWPWDGKPEQEYQGSGGSYLRGLSCSGSWALPKDSFLAVLESFIRLRMGLANTTSRAKKRVGPITRDWGRGERQEGCFPILVADICGWRVIRAHIFVVLIYLGPQKQKQSFLMCLTCHPFTASSLENTNQALQPPALLEQGETS